MRGTDVDAGFPAVAGELAQLEALRRMVRGAAHAWNNALTTIVGELGCLADERPDDPVVAAAAAAIEGEAQRCARLTRALQARADWQPGEPGEVDLGALAAVLEPVLRDTIPARVALAWEVPAEAPWVRARRVDAELLVVLAAHGLARSATAGAELRIAVGKPQDGCASVSMALAGGAAPAASAWDALVAEAAGTLAAACGGAWQLDAAAGRATIRFAYA